MEKGLQIFHMMGFAFSKSNHFKSQLKCWVEEKKNEYRHD